MRPVKTFFKRTLASAAAVALTGYTLSGAAVEKPLEEIVVTGSQLHFNAQNATPVIRFTATDIEQSTDLRLATLLQSIPQAGSAPNALSTGGFSTLSAGLSTMDLRSLSANRTLVLVNGRRVVGGDPDNPGVVDLNAINDALVKRVEVYSGGATAIYGSGAIAGVVNIITDTEFEGLTVKLQGGTSSENDGEEISLSITGGAQFAEQRGHAQFSLRWDRNEPIYSRDRGFSANNEYLGNHQFYSPFTPRGTIVSATGLKVPNQDNLWVDDFDQVEHGYNQALDRQLYIPLERIQWSVASTFELGNKVQTYFDLSGSVNESSNQQEANVLNFGSPRVFLPNSYPFFPQEILATWTDNNQPIPEQIQYYRRLNELGVREYQQDRNSWRAIAGLKAEIGPWQTDLSYQWSRTDFDQIAYGHFNTLFLSQALDIEEIADQPGSFQCASELARNQGCQPADIFNENGLSSQAIDFISAQQSTGAKLEVQEWKWTASRPLMDFGAGALQWLVGADYRRESIHSYVDSLTQSGLSSSVTLSPVNGRDDVTELYSELDIPLLSQQFIDYVGLNLAYRYSDYDSIGSAESWNAALTVSPIAQLDFYVRQSQAIRAPSIRELYLPPRGGTLNINDPCSAGIFAQGSTGQQNCAGLGIPNDFAPTVEELAVPYRLQGNQNLKEEVGDTTTLGVAYRPWNSPLLKIRADYFDIQIDDAIAIIDPMFKLYNCYDSKDFPNSPFCDGIARAGVEQNYRLNQLSFGSENIASLSTQGVDVEVSSAVNLLGGSLTNQLLLTYTDQWEEEANNRTLNKVGEPGLPRWKGNYRIGFTTSRWSTSLSADYHGSGVIENDPTNPYLIENNELPSVTVLNAFASYQFAKNSNNHYACKLFIGVHNLADKTPPYVPGNSRNGTVGTSTAAGVYDVRGRFINAGIEYEF